ncbi:MAG TPA: chalcone isomerase family protein, partial [Burkholderiaceae bacterium]|nr:chalcone isomerase family protein [Burkholderiaceae bacterium]
MKSSSTRAWLGAAALIAAVTLSGGAIAQAVEIEGVKLEPTAQVGGAALQLNGAGLRTRAIFKVYVAGLYVPAKSNNPATLLAQKGPRRLQMTMLRNVDADSFAAPLNDGLKNNHNEAQLAALKGQIDAFNATFKSVGEAKKGDVIGIEYLPDSGTRITVNGQPKGSPIAGEEFYNALLRIWLGDKPADGDLKKGL